MYVKRKYSYVSFCSEKTIKLTQQGSALLHQICATIVYNTDLVVLTLFLDSETSLMEISVYTVYMMVKNMMTNMVGSLTNGISATFGMMFVRNIRNEIKRVFSQYEFFYLMILFTIYSSMMGLILSFVNCYTRDIHDVNYIRIEFAVLFGFMGLLAQLKDASGTLIVAVGHYKQTQKYAVLEASVNLIISIVLVKPLGIIGVLIGTITSHIIMDMCYLNYVNKWLINGTINITIRRIIRNMIMCCIISALEIIYVPYASSWMMWVIEALIIGLINLVLFVSMNGLCERRKMRYMLKK